MASPATGQTGLSRLSNQDHRGPGKQNNEEKEVKYHTLLRELKAEQMKANQDQQDLIQEHGDKIASLERRNADLREEITDIDRQVGELRDERTKMQLQLARSNQDLVQRIRSLERQINGDNDDGAEHNNTTSASAADEESLFVDDDPAPAIEQLSNIGSTAEDPRIASTLARFVGTPYTKMVFVEWKGKGKAKVEISAPSHPRMTLLLFRKPTTTGYRYWKVGHAPSEGKVIRPSPMNRIIDFSPGSIKTLIAVFDRLRDRRTALMRQWRETNRSAIDLIWKRDAYSETPTNSVEVTWLAHQGVPGKLKVLVLEPSKSRRTIDATARGAAEDRRLIFLRGAQVKKDGRLTWTEQFVDVFTGQEVKRVKGDVVIPESEESYVRLWSLYNIIQAGDLVEPGEETWSLEAKHNKTTFDDENEPPASKKRKVHFAE
jgi:hypothetical protein